MRRAAASFLLFATVASAQTQAPKKSERKTVIVFDDPDDIAAEGLAPMLHEVVFHRGPDFKSILNVRENFRDKALQSVHEL